MIAIQSLPPKLGCDKNYNNIYRSGVHNFNQISEIKNWFQRNMYTLNIPSSLLVNWLPHSVFNCTIERKLLILLKMYHLFMSDIKNGEEKS